MIRASGKKQKKTLRTQFTRSIVDTVEHRPQYLTLMNTNHFEAYWPGIAPGNACSGCQSHLSPLLVPNGTGLRVLSFAVIIYASAILFVLKAR